MNKYDIKRVIEKLEPDNEMEYRISEKLRESSPRRVAFKPVAAIAAGLVMVIGAGAFASYHIDRPSNGKPVRTSQNSSLSDSSKAQLPDSKAKRDSEIMNENSGVVSSEDTKEILPENKPNSKSETIEQKNSIDSPKVQVAGSTGIKEQSNEISVPKVQLPENSTATAKMMGLIVYQGRIYLQGTLQIDPKVAEKLVGEKLGTTKGNITEWSKQNDYAVELASTVGIQDVYMTKGYDKSFRIMTCEKINGEIYAYFFECLNGITVKTGHDIFGKFKMENNIDSVKYENFDSWNNGKQDFKLLTKPDELNGFLAALENAIPYDRESLASLFDDQSATGQKFINLRLKDGSEIQLRLFKDGYVYYNGINLFFKVDSNAFNAFWNSIPSGNSDYSRTFTFDKDEEGWSGGFADLPVNYEPDIYDLDFKWTNIPIKGTTDKGLMLKGQNRSDDLFMYISRKFGKEDGLRPNTKYTVQLSFNLATNVVAGGMGVGGAPGESVYVKAGIINKEPIVENINGTRTINVDKGIQGNSGKDMQILGTIQKTESVDNTYEYKHFEKKFEITTNDKGEAWVIIGTDSGYEGLTQLYITDIKLVTARVFK